MFMDIEGDRLMQDVAVQGGKLRRCRARREVPRDR
jgi:hypothetical protein